MPPPRSSPPPLPRRWADNPRPAAYATHLGPCKGDALGSAGRYIGGNGVAQVQVPQELHRSSMHHLAHPLARHSRQGVGHSCLDDLPCVPTVLRGPQCRLAPEVQACGKDSLRRLGQMAQQRCCFYRRIRQLSSCQSDTNISRHRSHQHQRPDGGPGGHHAQGRPGRSLHLLQAS